MKPQKTPNYLENKNRSRLVWKDPKNDHKILKHFEDKKKKSMRETFSQHCISV